jgi:hypothetical protein
VKEGPGTVILNNPSSATPSFTFPTSDEFEPKEGKEGEVRKVTLELTVSNKDGSDTDKVDIFDGCFLKEKKFQTFRGGPWSFEYGILEKQGLVLRNINAGSERVLDSISIPHFGFEDASGNKKIVRFCDPEDQFLTIFDKLEPPKVAGGIANLKWEFTVDVGKNPDGTDREEEPLKERVTFEYDIPIFTKAVNNCELSKIECYRLIPKLNYLGLLEKVAVFYKLDYGYNTGLAPVLDTDDWASNVIVTSGGEHPFTTHETAFLAVRNGQPGQFDNIHTGHPGQSIFIPGCRYLAVFDCVHMHWRWSGASPIDPMVDPSTGKPLGGIRGIPNLVPDQTIAIAIVKNNPGEEDPDDISQLLNNERISSARAGAVGKGGEACRNCELVEGGDPIVWYVASVQDKVFNSFFRHGIFVLDTLVPGTQEREPLLTEGMNGALGDQVGGEDSHSGIGHCFPSADGTPAKRAC